MPPPKFGQRIVRVAYVARTPQFAQPIVVKTEE